MDDEDPREESVRVCCRFRPQIQIEQGHTGRICVTIPDSTTVCLAGTGQSFAFDRVFPPEASQEDVYDYAARPTVNSVLRGFNGTVFAYGQTSSGKTYTMEGPDIQDKVLQGVIPRMVWSVFDGICHADEHIEFLVKVSIVEIYNERIRDLLDPNKDNLTIHEDKLRGVFIGEVTETYVGSEQEIFELMRNGQVNRATAVTNMNEHSSRSHLVFMLTIEQRNLLNRSVKLGKLHLVDLAGSEKVAKTGASGDRLDEAKNINRSLSALGNVINALTDKSYTHVPYRDSKLTRVLQESLGGNSKTSLIITCSPSNFNEQETASTLRFGQRAKMIKNVVKINHERSTEELKLLLERRDETVAELRQRLATFELLLGRAAAGAAPGGPPAMAADEIMGRVQELAEELHGERARVSELTRENQELAAALALREQQAQRLSASASGRRGPGPDGAQERLKTTASAPQDCAWVACRPVPSATPPVGGGAGDSDSARMEHMRRSASQAKQRMEQLMLLYHDQVKLDSALRVEQAEIDMKMQKKDQRIGQLERNLRDMSRKYEKLLAHHAEALVLSRGDSAGFDPAAGGGGGPP